MSDAMGKGVRLAGPSARDDQKRGTRPAMADTVFNRGPLVFVQAHRLVTSCARKHSCARVG